MKTRQFIYAYMLAGLATLAGCSDDFLEDDPVANGNALISLSGEIDQLAGKRVNDNGFCDGDVMGVYIVDFNGNEPGALQVSGNRGDNVRHTFNETDYSWNSAYDLYWKDKHTHIDVYGYYPFGDPESIDAYDFTVQRDQSTEGEDGEMGGYEASDFLWGKVADVAPTTTVIRLPMQHRMANARVTLVEGEGFAAGEWTDTEKIVLATNLKREATINLADGTVTAVGDSSSYGKYLIVAHSGGFSTLYAHCSKIIASSGQTVKEGQTIAEVGETGVATGPHLHLELHQGDRYLNPIYYVSLA